MMKMLSLTILLATVGALAVAPDPTSSYYAPGIPTDTPIAGDYADFLRPKVHFSPPKNFMNETYPNGLHRDASGLWHLYYQYNPLTPVAGNQHWGHATSDDLYTWTNQKIALWPPDNSTYVYSGSAVLDPNNTSGFFPNQTNGVVAIYTLAEFPDNVAGIQYQAISYSRDGGYTFSAYENNPVLNLNSTQFRDPYVLWHAPTQKWVMVISYAAEWTVGVFTSPDLKEWSHASNFTKHGYLGGVYGQYECPNLLQLPMQGQEEPVWMMLISINPGGPRGGSISQYFVGDFNGTHFTAYDEASRFTDFGKDNYAAQFFHGLEPNEPQIALGWASNWQYAQTVPTGEEQHGQFRSAMTVPRSHYIANVSARGYDLISDIHDIGTVVNQGLAYNSSLGNGSIFTTFDGNAPVYLEVNIISTTGTANFTLSSSVSGEYIQGGINAAGAPGIWVDRGHLRGFDNPYFSDKFSEEGIAPANGIWTLTVLYDGSVLELFLNGGQAAGTLSVFPSRPLDVVSIFVDGVKNGSVGVRSLRDTWLEQEDGNGTVKGHVTMGRMAML